MKQVGPTESQLDVAEKLGIDTDVLIRLPRSEVGRIISDELNIRKRVNLRPNQVQISLAEKFGLDMNEFMTLSRDTAYRVLQDPIRKEKLKERIECARKFTVGTIVQSRFNKSVEGPVVKISSNGYVYIGGVKGHKSPSELEIVQQGVIKRGKVQ